LPYGCTALITAAAAGGYWQQMALFGQLPCEPSYLADILRVFG
jgi:hypothetical protein